MELQILFFIINLSCIVAELSLRFVFITEHHEADLPQKLGEAIKFTEETIPAVRFSEDVIHLDRENEEESYRQLCSSISKGVSAIIDLSWAPWSLAEELTTQAGIPLLRTVLGSQELVAAFDKYLALRNATDAVFILESETDVDQILYELLGQSNTRVWVHAGLTRESANALKSMRPDPSFYVIAGRNNFVMKTYARETVYFINMDLDVGVHNRPMITKISGLIPFINIVIETPKYFTVDFKKRAVLVYSNKKSDAITSSEHERVFWSQKLIEQFPFQAVREKLVRRDFRWNLLLSDYVTLDVSQLVLPTVVLQIDADECCKFMGIREECHCPRDFKRQQSTLNSLIQHLTEVYSKLDPDLQFTIRANCEDLGEGLNMTKDQLYKHLADDGDAKNETVFFWDEERYSILLRSKFVLSTYKPDEGLEVIAKWSANEDLKLLPGAVLEPLKNFFRVGTSPAIPWTMPKLDPQSGKPMMDDNGNPVYQGYCIDLIAKLAEVMNFDYEVITPKSGTFGRRLQNGSWDGIIDDLMRGETDIALAALTMTAEREEVIDFVAPYFEQTGILIVIRRPIRKTSLFKFMTVLRTEVWLSIVGALLLTGFMIWILEKYSPYSARNNPEAYPYPCRNFTLKESFWFALTSFTPQGGGEAPKALSGRTLVAAYWLFVVLMLATFTANLAAFLTVERMQTPVSSLEQLARQSRINYTVVEGSSIHQYFINMKFAEDTLYRVWKEITLNATSDQAQYRVWDYPIREQYGHILLAINASVPVPDAVTGFRQVNDHTEADFAFIHDSAEIKYELTRNCNMTEVGEVFAEQPYAIAVQQGSRLQEDLSRALLDLQKERFLEQLTSKYWNETARQSCPDADESEGITLESLGGVFIATLFGLGLAMITLAWEVFYYKRKEKNKVRAVDATVEKAIPKLPFQKMADSVSKLRRRGKRAGKIKNVTIGDKFRPVGEKGVSFISVYPKGGYNP